MSNWKEELLKKFHKGKKSDICLCWNDDNYPLVFGSSIESIKDELINFISQLRLQDKEEQKTKIALAIQSELEFLVPREKIAQITINILKLL